MNLRWTRAAIGDLAAIRRQLAKDNPEAAARMGRRLRSAAEILLDHPAAGRAGRIPETRELVVPGTAYILPYRVRGTEIQVLRVLHGARECPSSL